MTIQLMRPEAETRVRYRLTQEQEDLRSAVRRALDVRATPEAVRAALEVGSYDLELWTTMADELGLVALNLPEELGGVESGMTELAVVMEELGRRVVPSPFLATVILAMTALRLAGGEAADTLLSEIGSGATATVAFTEDRRSHEAVGGRSTATSTTAGWTVTGAEDFVLDGATASILLLLADTADNGISLFAVRRDAPGVVNHPMETLDLTRPQARVRFDHAPATAVGRLGDGVGILRRTLQLARVALAAEQVGGAARSLESAVAYAQARVQFGRPIGGFQAIKHKCADLFIAIELARTAAARAARIADLGTDELALASALAAAVCADAFTRAATETIHIHGGIGFTWEHDAHLYFRRAKADETLLGTPRQARAMVLEALGV